ncbi:Putative gustatory receptor 28b [Dufourea novaeangliae]|uniref:Gustatory receptor n=1 Tax=Dufourea novaeangliae TaxID=178035 RepID=A0A154PGK2_DUFNO|nr:Putative gustatory receptor 28b [Dufourea novaeangliae]
MSWVMLLFFLLFKVIGLGTVSLRVNISKNKGSGDTLSFRRSPFGMPYNLALCCLVVVLDHICLPAIYYSDYVNKTIITMSIEIFQGIYGSLMIFITLVCYCVNQSHVVRIGNYLIHVEEQLHRLHSPTHLHRVFWILIIVYFCQLVLFIAVLVTEHLAFHASPLVWLMDIGPSSFASWILIQYFSVISLIDANFTRINNAIQNLCRSSHYDVYMKSLSQSRRLFVSSSTMEFLLQLRDIHNHLCDVSAEVSRFYSMPVLMSISYMFFTLLYNSYYLLEPVIVENTVLDVMSMVNTILWVIYIIYPLSLLTNKITSIVDKIQETGIFVQALLKCAIDPETKSELREFSLQLLHRRIKFTANGCFNLDNTLLQSIVSTVTTYLVILIQFQMGSSCHTISKCNCTES